MLPALLGGTFAALAALKYLQLTTIGQVRIPAFSGGDQLLNPTLGTTLIGAIIFFLAAVLALAFCPLRREGPLSTRDSIRSVPKVYAVLVIAAFAGTGGLSGFVLATLLNYTSHLANLAQNWAAFCLISLGPPLLVISFFVGELVYCALTSGFTSNVRWGEAEREWLARAAGYHGRAAITWATIVIVTFGGSAAAFSLPDWGLKSVALTGGVAGILTTFIGKATSTAATLKKAYSSLRNLSAAVILAIATPIFIIIALSLLSWLIDEVAVGRLLWFDFNSQGQPDTSGIIPLLYIAGVTAVVAAVASYVVNTNQFSLHGMYRNRLIRTFLGASNADRRPNNFTDFDQSDNIALSSLWPNAAPIDVPPQLHVLNMALNIVATRELAWQQRKALSFTATSRWIGCGDLSEKGVEGTGIARGYYRLASEYGGPMTLGTAVTISGAAASPNMGYHSSPALSLLLTFFNVRLGAWLGNTNCHGDLTYKIPGPRFAARPMISEAFGLTNDEKPYVYLSDGGHFENLGLYEMVRRRCHLIIVSDAGCDPKCDFEDLGNALLRISVDLNIEVKFRSLKIQPRAEPVKAGTYCAVADIIYRDEGATPGVLLYLKPGYQGDEPVPVRSYAAKSVAFPHELTADQWFKETQFEAYRALGQHVVRSIDGNTGRTYPDIKAFIGAVAARLN